MVDAQAGILVCITGAGVSDAFDSIGRPNSNDFRSTVVAACNFIKGEVTTNLNPSFSGAVVTSTSGINLATVGGTGAVYYPFSN